MNSTRFHDIIVDATRVREHILELDKSTAIKSPLLLSRDNPNGTTILTSVVVAVCQSRH
jgi:hypothetical protein